MVELGRVSEGVRREKFLPFAADTPLPDRNIIDLTDTVFEEGL